MQVSNTPAAAGGGAEKKERTMQYTMTSPCADCPFLNEVADMFPMKRLKQFAGGAFPCHKTAVLEEEVAGYVAGDKSVHCAGALIFLEKRKQPNQMMRIAERLGLYRPSDLNMKADVR